MHYWLMGLMLLSTTSAFAQGGAMDKAQGKALSDLGALFDTRMAALKVVGGSFCVVRDGKVVFTRSYGYADQEQNRKTDEGSLYVWGSNTKLFTDMAIIQLRDHGKLSLDDPLVKYIPTFSKVNNPFNNTDKITLRQLMSHSSGLQNGSFPLPLSWHKPWPSWSQLEPLFPYRDVEYQPGTKYQYSNLGLLLLGKVIEIVTNDDYEVYIDKNILKPLKMYQTYYDTTPYHLLPQKAQGYYPYEEGKPRKLYHPDIDQGVTSSNGGLKAPITDFAKFAAFVIGGSDPVYDVVLKRSSLEEMFQEVLPIGKDEGPGDAICLGFHKRKEGLQFTMWGHTGSANGFRSEFDYNPDTRTAFFMVINTENGEEAFAELRKYMDTTVLPLWKPLVKR